MSGQEIATRNPSVELAEWATGEERIQQYAMALPDDVHREPFARALKTALISKPELLKADRASLYLAILNAAQLGLVPDGRQGAIVVYGDKAQFLTMIGGVRDTLAKYGWMLQTSVVYEADAFSFDEAAQRVMHVPPRLGSDRGPIIGAYAQATHKDGRQMAEVMSLADIHLVRDKSGRKNPAWSDKQSYPRMVEKTPGHRLAKKLPLDPKDRERVDRVLAAEELDPAEATTLMYGKELVNPQTGELTTGSPTEEPATSPADGEEGQPSPPTAAVPGGDEGDPGGGEDPQSPASVREPTEADELAALDAALFKCPGGKYGPDREGGALTIGEIHALPDGEGVLYLADRLARLQEGEFRAQVEAFCKFSMSATYMKAMATREARV